jgi:hypothetical protein
VGGVGGVLVVWLVGGSVFLWLVRWVGGKLVS